MRTAKIQISPCLRVLTIKRKQKSSEMSSAKVVYCNFLLIYLTNLSIETNSVNPDQTAPIGAVRSGSTQFA